MLNVQGMHMHFIVSASHLLSISSFGFLSHHYVFLSILFLYITLHIKNICC